MVLKYIIRIRDSSIITTNIGSRILEKKNNSKQ